MSWFLNLKTAVLWVSFSTKGSTMRRRTIRPDPQGESDRRRRRSRSYYDLVRGGEGEDGRPILILKLKFGHMW